VVAPTVRHSRLLQDLPTALDAEQVDELLQRPNLRIERIVSTGQASAKTFWYDQAEHEWVIVLSGRAKLRYEHEYAEVELGPGDAAFIPAHTRLDDPGRAYGLARVLLDRSLSSKGDTLRVHKCPIPHRFSGKDRNDSGHSVLRSLLREAHEFERLRGGRVSPEAAQDRWEGAGEVP